VLAVAHPCLAPLPHGPRVPAPIVLRTSCGAFRLARDGAVSRVVPLRGGGTGRRFGATIQLRRTHAGLFVLLEHGRVLWRSSGAYPNDGGSVAFGPHSFAFGTYRRGVFLTDLRSPERRVLRGRGLYPVDFTGRGLLIVGGTRTIDVVSRDGVSVRRYAYRSRNAYAFDERTDTLFFVTPHGVLASLCGAHLRLEHVLHRVDGTITIADDGLLVFTGAHDVVVTRRDGTVVTRTRWRPSLGGQDAGVSVSPDGRTFAFRLSTARPGAKSARAVVELLRAGGTRAHPLYAHALGPSGCAVGANLSWSGRFLLYASTDGRRAVLDTRRGRVLDLRRLARALPHRWNGELADAYWASDFRR
jgi:hypothetical protein